MHLWVRPQRMTQQQVQQNITYLHTKCFDFIAPFSILMFYLLSYFLAAAYKVQCAPKVHNIFIALEKTHKAYLLLLLLHLLQYLELLACVVGGAVFVFIVIYIVVYKHIDVCNKKPERHSHAYLYAQLPLVIKQQNRKQQANRKTKTKTEHQNKTTKHSSKGVQSKYIHAYIYT